MSRRWAAGVLGLAILLASAAPLLANQQEEASIRAFFAPGELKYEELFAPSFLQAVPRELLTSVRQDYLTKLGDLKEVVGGNSKYELRFQKGKCPSEITLGSDGLIIGFWLGPISLTDDSLDAVLAELKALDGAVSLALLRDGKELVVGIEPDQPLAVGSSFKLYILEALAQKVAAGQSRWDAVINLDKALYSLPSGVLQTWPDKTPVTIQSLANVMISISDNTATDHLLFYAGRDAVEAVAPARVRPFYSTAEMFWLKWGMNPQERDRYLAADLAAKREILAGISQIPLDQVHFQDKPVLIDQIEWMITTRELCDVIYKLRENPALSINPGLADKQQWQTVGFKGGSEPGVLNHTYILSKGQGSPWWALSMTINNPTKAIDEDKFSELVGRMIGMISDGKIK